MMKSRSKNRTPNIVNLTVKRLYLTEREVERLMDYACKHGRYGHRDATMRSGLPASLISSSMAQKLPVASRSRGA